VSHFRQRILIRDRKEVKRMKQDKKTYEAPELVAHGTVEELTLQGGGNFVDVPIGTPIGPNISGTSF